MKRIPLFILMVAIPFALAVAYDRIVGGFGPATSSSNVTITAPGNDLENCISFADVNISAYGANTANILVLDGLTQATTVYSVTVSSSVGTTTNMPFKLPSSDEDPLCAASNNALQIKCTAGTFTINYNGHIRRTR
jgi:hypothetical protein